MVSKIYSATPTGYTGALIEVECDSKRGLPTLQIVGMGAKSIDESKERVRSAIENSLLEFPARKIIINLAPAELPKDGAQFDLAIAVAILTISGQLQESQVANSLFVGELALNGSLRPIKGIINIIETAKNNNIPTVYLPTKNLAQAQLVEGIELIAVSTLSELFLHLKKEVDLSLNKSSHTLETPSEKLDLKSYITLDDISGQDQAKRALVIAAAGGHNLLMSGPPGSGKTMLAKALLSLLPDLSPQEIIEVTKLHSIAGESTQQQIVQRPFRAPHHTSSRTALIGGGSKPKPGEISLAHCGVLFLDEMPEYPRSTIESLRQPLEDHVISISRAQEKVEFPARFTLIGTMNPCPCGYYGDPTKECSCTTTQLLHYNKKLSGPVIDRIDLTITVPRMAIADLTRIQNKNTNLQHDQAKKQIENARHMQSNRYKRCNKYNAHISSSDTRTYINLETSAEQLVNRASEKLDLSARSYFKLLKVARTIADMEASSSIKDNHIAEALQYRQIGILPL